MPIAPRRIRIFQIIPHLNLGGAERMVVNLSIGLDPNLFDIRVITFFDPIEITELYQTLIEHNIQRDSLNKNRKRKFDLQPIIRLDRLIADFQPDIIHTHLAALQYAILPSLHHRIRSLVHTPHNMPPNNASAFGHIVRRLSFNRIIQPVAIAKEVQQSLVDFYKIPPPPIIHNGIDLDIHKCEPTIGLQWRERAGFSSDDCLIVCVAGLRLQKNHSLLLNSFNDLANNRNNQLLLVGDGALRPEIEAQIVRLNLQEQVHLLGWRSDIPAILAASDIFVLPSHWEGHSMSIMEAMAASLPIVATQVGGNPTLIQHEHSGLLVPPNDQQSLTQALVTLLQDPVQRNALGQAARQHAENEFSKETMTRHYAELYQKLLAKGDSMDDLQ